MSDLERDARAVIAGQLSRRRFIERGLADREGRMVLLGQATRTGSASC